MPVTPTIPHRFRHFLCWHRVTVAVLTLCLPMALLSISSCCPCPAPNGGSTGSLSNIGNSLSYGSSSYNADGLAARKRVPATAARLRVMTWNVNYGGAGRAEAIKLIHETDADLVCLQETTGEWAYALKAVLSEQYPYQKYQDEGGAGGQGILSKHPIRTIAYIRPTAGWFPGWVIQTDSPAGPVQCLNVHLRPPLADDGSVTVSAYFGADDIHKREIEEFLPGLKPDLPTLVTGDFNEEDCGGAICRLGQAQFANALPQFDRLTTTWHWQTKLLELTGRYDHILHSPEWTCLSAAVIKKGQSDHYPVVAEFARTIPADEPAPLEFTPVKP